jgi:diadenosine tetraphosphate (Ap4A) HIT family hydrolase
MIVRYASLNWWGASASAVYPSAASPTCHQVSCSIILKVQTSTGSLKITVRTFKMPCPFCMIADSIPPAIEPKVLTNPLGSAYPVLSTPTVIAFLDIAPVTPGHILLCPRRHCVKATDMTVAESAALGVWLPILTGALLKVLGTNAEEACWNIIQANGRIV